MYTPLEINNGTVPTRIQLIPAGEVIQGRDGRKFGAGDAQAILQAFKDHGMDLPVDVEHATEIKAPMGEPAPAVGWVKALESANDGIWALVDWNEDGRELIESKQYRYVSPVFTVDAKTKEIFSIDSVALTNRPNLKLKSLNSEEKKMDLTVTESVTVGDVSTTAQSVEVAAEPKAKKESVQQDSDVLMVPASHALEWQRRAEELEAQLAQVKKDEFEREVNSAITEALRASKIEPSSEQTYRAMCSTQHGLEQFKKFIKHAKPLVPSMSLDELMRHREPNSLNADEIAFCKHYGLNEGKYLAQKVQLHRQKNGRA